MQDALSYTRRATPLWQNLRSGKPGGIIFGSGAPMARIYNAQSGNRLPIDAGYSTRRLLINETLSRIECDVLVVGGGINGAAIARDAAGRGLSVVLCEKDDLAAHTSSASSKLVHGGLRYLENFEFGHVRKALAEREVLLRCAPHIIRPLRFVMPHDQGQRPAWMIRVGLFLYDRLARREFLPGAESLALRQHAAGQPLKARFTRGFAYSDAWVDDARLVVLNALDAALHGARVLTHTRCIAARRTGRQWQATLVGPDGAPATVVARALVNAAGPWALEFLQLLAPAPARQAQRLVKGSHIIVRRLFDHPCAYIFQHPDRRIVFAIPYERDFTLIGTTDLDYHGDLDHVAISAAEVDYLCRLVGRYFEQQIGAQDVLCSFAGVRPLLGDAARSAAATSRDYRLLHDGDGAPLLSVFGGKITTARKLAEEALDWLAPALGHAGRHWTAGACLPGGDIFGATPCARAVLEFDTFIAAQQRRYAWLAPGLVARYARAYGTRMALLLDGCSGMAGMGEEILPGLFALELAYLVRHEWAHSGADVLWRRSKLGLHLPPASTALLDAVMHRQRSMSA